MPERNLPDQEIKITEPEDVGEEEKKEKKHKKTPEEIFLKTLKGKAGMGEFTFGDIKGKFQKPENDIKGDIADLVRDGYVEVSLRGGFYYYKIKPEFFTTEEIEKFQNKPIPKPKERKEKIEEPLGGSSDKEKNAALNKFESRLEGVIKSGRSFTIDGLVYEFNISIKDGLAKKLREAKVVLVPDKTKSEKEGENYYFVKALTKNN